MGLWLSPLFIALVNDTVLLKIIHLKVYLKEWTTLRVYFLFHQAMHMFIQRISNLLSKHKFITIVIKSKAFQQNVILCFVDFLSLKILIFCYKPNCLYNYSFTPDCILIRMSFQTLALNVNFINASTACNGDPDIQH
jgi:hypothetical protein